MNPLRTAEDYELFVYTLSDQFPAVRRSTVAFIRRGASLARVVGDLYFDHEIRLVVRERILYHRLPAVIDEYGYEDGVVRKSCNGMILNSTQPSQAYEAHIHIINTCLPTSNTIGFLPRV